MPRLFTAIDPPTATIERLRTFCDAQDVPFEARWTPPSNYHITLRFIGEVDAGQADALDAALARVEAAPFTVAPIGLNVLPSRRSPRVLMVAIEASAALQALYEAVSDALAEEGVARESRSYRPHLTIARLKNADPADVHRFLRNAPSLDLDPFLIHRFTLYESTLQPDGAVHTARRAYALHDAG